MMFSSALDLRLGDFRDVAKRPLPLVCGLIAQSGLLPSVTWFVNGSFFPASFLLFCFKLRIADVRQTLGC